MKFAFWPALILLAVFPFLYRVWLRRNQPPELQFPESPPVSARGMDPVKLSILLRVLSLAFLIVALARPQIASRYQERKVSGIDIMLTLDVSMSMLAEDLSEQNRLDVAKDTILQFVSGRTNDRIGILIFSGDALTLVPPTLDYPLVLDAIKKIRLGDLLSGTAIGEGLALAVNRLKHSTAKSRVIVLLTDGENNRGKIAPLTAGELAKGFGIRVYSIAVGREGRVRVPNVAQLPDGRLLKQGYQWFDNQLDTKLLEQISTATGGAFYRVTDAQALKNVFSEIDRLERTEIKSVTRVQYSEHFRAWLMLGFVLLAIERLLAFGVLKWVA